MCDHEPGHSVPGMRKTTICLPLIAALAATPLAVPLASAPAASPAGSFTLTATFDPKSLVTQDVRPKGHSAGDLLVFSAALRRGGRPAGRGEYVQHLVDNRYRGEVTNATLLLGDGTLELQGAGVEKTPTGAFTSSDDASYAILGGTGAYAGATGTVTAKDTGATTQRLSVTLGG